MLIEKSILAFEKTAFSVAGGQYRSFEVKTLLKAWGVLAGVPRPEIPFDHSEEKKVSTLPATCNGNEVTTVYSYHLNLIMTILIGKPLRKYRWDAAELELIKRYKVRLCVSFARRS